MSQGNPRKGLIKRNNPCNIKAVALSVQSLTLSLTLQREGQNDRITDRTKTICPGSSISGTQSVMYTNQLSFQLLHICCSFLYFGQINVFVFPLSSRKRTHRGVHQDQQRSINKADNNKRKSEQAHIPHAPTLLENAAHYAYYHYEGWYWSIM